MLVRRRRSDTGIPDEDKPIPAEARIHRTLPRDRTVGRLADVRDNDDLIFLNYPGEPFPWTLYRGRGNKWYASAGCVRDIPLRERPPDFASSQFLDPEGEFVELRLSEWQLALLMTDGLRG